MGEPTRIQLSRAKGWRMPPNTVIVSRPSKWGNPFDWQEARDEWGGTEFEAKAAVAMIYRDWLTMQEPERFHPDLRGRRVAAIAGLADLRGKNLACWCAIHKNGDPVSCHADVLLKLANGDRPALSPLCTDETRDRREVGRQPGMKKPPVPTEGTGG